jgi:transcriptional regulator with XRE-family HTH domain
MANISYRIVATIAFVNDEERASAYTAAILEQLNAEIAARDSNVKALAKRMNMDYGTLRRYTEGERPLPMTKLWQALDTLGIDYGVFTRRASERLEENRAAGKRGDPR